MVAVSIGPLQRAVVAATPAYLADHAPLRDLGDHAGILRRFLIGRLYHREFEKDGAEVTVAMRESVGFNDNWLFAKAALTGAGLALFEGTAEQEIADGRLVRVLEDWRPPFAGFFLYYPQRDLMRPVLRAFIDFTRNATS